MKTMITDLDVGDQAITFFFVSETPQLRKSKKNTDYLCLKLQDKTGTIDGRVWEIPLNMAPDDIKKGSFIKVRGTVSEWNEEKQIAIDLIRLVETGDDIDLGDFFERSEQDPEEMFDELVQLVTEQLDPESPVKKLLLNILRNNREKLLQAPAAKGVHHAYIGGLLEHILSMSKLAVLVSSHYTLHSDLVIAACVLHDIGKLHELTYPIGIGYSLEGTLIGHISIGMEMVANEIRDIDNFPQKIKLALLHLIASHHGTLEWGSPKVPLMREAVLFHLIDMMDAQNMICLRAQKKGMDEQGLTEWVKEFGGPLFVYDE